MFILKQTARPPIIRKSVSCFSLESGQRKYLHFCGKIQKFKTS